MSVVEAIYRGWLPLLSYNWFCEPLLRVRRFGLHQKKWAESLAARYADTAPAGNARRFWSTSDQHKSQRRVKELAATMGMTNEISTVSTTQTDQTERLAKNLKPSWVWAIALGSAVGWGAFVLPTDWIATAGPGGALLGFALGGALMIVIGVSYGFLVRTFPVSGGAFAYALVGFGRRHAFVCAWFLTLGYTSIVALNASALGVLARRVVPQVAEIGYLYQVAGWDVYLGEVFIAMAALAVFAVLNIRGANVSGRSQFIFCVIMVSAVALILAGVVVHPEGIISNAEPWFASDKTPIAAVLAITAIAPWAFIGFDNIPQAAEEFDFSPKKAFMLIVWSLLAATALYCAMIFATALAAPSESLLGQDRVWGTADAIVGLFGTVGLVLLCVAATMGIATGLNGFFVSGSRVLLALGRAQMIPSAFARVHPKHGTPHVGILFVMMFCLISPWFGRQALSWIVDMSAIGFTFGFLYTCLCAYRLFRWSGQEEHDEVEGACSTAKKLLAGFGVLISLAFTALLILPGSPAQMSVPAMIAMAVWIIVGVIFYLVRRKTAESISDETVDLAVLGRPRPSTMAPASRARGGQPAPPKL